MPAFFNDEIFHKGLEHVQLNANVKMVLCKQAPADFTAASTLHPTGDRLSDVVTVLLGDMTLGDKAGGGRECNVAAKAGAVATGVNLPVLDSGTATSGGTNTLTDSGASFPDHTDKAINIVAGTGAGQARIIQSNTATVVTVTDAWTTQPDATSEYQISWDLHYALYDSVGSALLYYSDETSNQGLTAENPINFEAFAFGMGDPTVVP